MTDAIWVCQIESYNEISGWQAECALVRTTQDSVIEKAASVIKNDLWSNRGVLSESGIKDKLAASDQTGGCVEIQDDSYTVPNIKVTITETTDQV